MLISHSPPKGTRLGYLAKIEGGEWIATLGGYGGDFPSTSDRGFLDFARSLPARFQKRLAKSNSLSWMLATGQDLRFATTQGGGKPIKSDGFYKLIPSGC